MNYKIKNIMLHTLLTIFAVIFLYPILVITTNSFMSGFEIINRYSVEITPANSYDYKGSIHFAEISLIPVFVTLKQYKNFLLDTPFYLGLFFNSVKITFPIVAGQLVIAVPAAYAFEYSRIKYKEALYMLYIIIMILPLQVTLVPNYIVAEFLNIEDSYLAIILPAIFNPFGVFLIRQYLKGIPIEYANAAKMDGAGDFQAFLYVVLPIVRSGIAALSMLTFVEYWNTVDQAIFFIKETAMEPLSLYLSHITEGSGISIIFAASCFYMLPAVLIFLHGQEHMIEGIQLSGL